MLLALVGEPDHLEQVAEAFHDDRVLVNPLRVATNQLF
jgi:hypothetical protein